MQKLLSNKHVNDYIKVLLGSLLFCAATNFFIVPLGLYSGGVIGFSQILRTVLIRYCGFPADFEVAGIIYFIFNIPLLFLAFRSISKDFFIKTVVAIAIQTLLFTVIPILQTPILKDTLSSCLIGGALAGVGAGTVLWASGSCGGIDILGFYLTMKNKDFSVGKLSIFVNTALFLACAILFDIETAIYSVICIIVMSMMIDRIHFQNINTLCIVFTKNKDIPQRIITDMHRGVTLWNGLGAYTMSDMTIFITIISKYEIHKMKELLRDSDPKAFYIFLEGANVSGNFEKRL